MSEDSIELNVVRHSSNDGSTIVHQLFHNGRPFGDVQSFEYVLPLRNVAPKHNKIMCDWIGSFGFLDSASAASRFKTHLKGLNQQNEFTELLLGLQPFSVLFHGDACWLLCKNPAESSNPSAHGNMVLVPSPTLSPQWPDGWQSASFAPLKKLLAHFGGMRFHIPAEFPQLFRAVDIRQETATTAYGDFYNLRSWLGSHVVYNINNVDRVLVDDECRFGRTDHGYSCQDFVLQCANLPCMDEHDDGSVFLIGHFDDFVNFLVSQAGIA